MQSEKQQLEEISIQLCERLFLDETLINELDNDVVEQLLKGLVSVIKPTDTPRSDSRRLAIVVLKNIAKKSHSVSYYFYETIGLMVINV